MKNKVGDEWVRIKTSNDKSWKTPDDQCCAWRFISNAGRKVLRGFYGIKTKLESFLPKSLFKKTLEQTN